VLAAAHLRGALGADLVAAGVHLPPVPAEVDVVNSHVPVELAASGVVVIKLFCVLSLTLRQGKLERGARYLTGVNLKVAWAEFSTLS